jgi:uncharacterized protein (TIGR03083 family)
MTAPATVVTEIPAIDHREAMTIATNEAARLLDLVQELDPEDWSRATDCEGWDVKALLSHVLGGMEANARLRVFVRQWRAATQAAKRTGRPIIDEMTEAQVRDHASLSPAELTRQMRTIAPDAVAGRRRIPAPMRALPFKPGPPIEGSWKLGYLVDTILNRDSWMHRVDLAHATGSELVLTREHDGRIVADVVAEWARAHAQPFTLMLDGPAGGAFAHGENGESLHLDAVEFCRTLSGRSTASGLLSQEVPF